jgi:hypothetical protein
MKAGDSGSPRWKEQGTLQCSGVLMEEAQLPSKETYPFIFPPQSLACSIQKFPAESEFIFLFMAVFQYLQFLILALTLCTPHAWFQGCWRSHNLSTQFLHKGVQCQWEMLHGQGTIWRYLAQFLVRITEGHHCQVFLLLIVCIDSHLIPMQSSVWMVCSAHFRPLAGFTLSLELSMPKSSAGIFLLSWVLLDLILLHLWLLLYSHSQEGLLHCRCWRSPAIALFPFLYHLQCLPGLFTFMMLNRRNSKPSRRLE